MDSQMRQAMPPPLVAAKRLAQRKKGAAQQN
jgi:hypothetical protein